MKTKKVIEEYLKSLKGAGRSGATIRAHRRYLLEMSGHMQEKYQKNDVREITKKDLEDFQLYVMTRKAHGTDRIVCDGIKNNIITIVKLFFKYLTMHEYVMEDIACKFERIAERNSIPRQVLTLKEAERLFNSINRNRNVGRRNYCLLKLLYHTGIRSEELTQIRISDFDLKDQHLIITGKYSKVRVIPLGKNIRDILKDYLQEVRPRLLKSNISEERLFISNIGKQLCNQRLNDLIKWQTKKAGIKKHVTVHTFRHSFATHMLKNGASIRHIQEILGHERLGTTEVYTRVVINDLKAVYNRTHPRAMLFEGGKYRRKKNKEKGKK